VKAQGYITGYTETDTLATVTTRGNTTTNTITVGGATSNYLLLTGESTLLETKGILKWESDHNTVGLYYAEGQHIDIGQTQVWYVKNTSGSIILKGQVVMATGAVGNSGNLEVQPLIADGSVSGKFALGIAKNNIGVGLFGFAMTEGTIRGIDTSEYAIGTVLWANPDIPGELTSVEPTAPALKLPIAFVVSAANNGAIGVRMSQGLDLREVHDVNISSVANGQLLRYNNGIWENWSPNFLTSYTETDPIFTASAAAGITSTNISNWNTAYGWGDHSQEGYLVDESDPIFAASAASSITTTNISNWNTAYGWGNHALAGYATETWVGLNYYNSGQIDDFFSGAEAISGYNKSNWDTAFGWGNHASAGYATQSYVNTAISNLVDAAPSTLDTLNELAAALGDDPNFATTVSTNIGTKVSKSGDTMTGSLQVNNKIGTTDNQGIFLRGIGDVTHKIYFRSSDGGNVWEYNSPIKFEFYNGGTPVTRLTLTEAGNLTITGTLSASGYNNTNWDTAYNDRITAAAVTGTSTKTLTLTQGDGGTVVATWTDYDTDNDAQQLTWEAGSKNLSISNGNTVTLDGLATEEFVTSQGYITSYTETDTLATVVSRGNSTSLAIRVKRPSNKVDNSGATEFGGRIEFNNDFVAGESGYMVFRYPTYNNFLIGGDYDGNIGGAVPNIQFGRVNGSVYMHIAAQSGTGYVGINTTSPDSPLEVNGRISIRGANELYFGQSTSAIGTWTTRMYASGSTHKLNAQQFIFNNEGYGSLEFMLLNASGFSLRGKNTIDSTDSWLRLNQAGEYASGVYTPYVLRNDGEFINYGGIFGYNTIRGRKAQANDNYTTAALWTESYDNTTTGIAFHISGNVGKFLEMRTDGVLYWENTPVATRSWVQSQGYLTSETDSQTLSWEAGSKNLTISNGNTVTLDGLATEEYVTSQGYITGYTETDTLATVTGRGATTNTSITTGPTISIQADGSSGYVASRLYLYSHNNFRGAGVFMSGTGSTWFAGTPYTDFDQNYIIARKAVANTDETAQFANALLRVNATGDVYVTRNLYANYVLGTYANFSSGNSENPTIGQIWTQSTGDDYLRKSTPAHFRSQIIDGYYLPLSGGTITTSTQYGVTINHSPVLGDFVDALLLRSTTSGQRAQIGFATVDADGDHHRASIRAYKGSGNYEGVFGIALRQTNATHVQRFTLTSAGNLTIDGQINVSGGNSSQWNTAYSWGNHADASYFKLDTQDPITIQSETVTFSGNVVIEGTLTESSSIRFKENIKPLEPALGKVEQLNPVTYNKIGVVEEEIGLIAEEVAELFPEVVTHNEEGQVQGVQYQRLSVILLKAMQEQNAVIAALTERVNKLENT
jgi:hypothetical protein